MKEVFEMRYKSMLLAIVALAGTSAGLAASPFGAAPAGCSAADQALIASYSQGAVNALAGGDSQRLVQLTRALETSVSPACRTGIAQSQPARSRCSADERRIAMSRYQGIMRAALNGDTTQVIELVERLEGSISPACWIALNYPQDARIRQAYIAGELGAVASASVPLMRAAMTGDIARAVELTLDLQDGLSQACWIALNYSEEMQQACSPPELNQMVPTTRPLTQALLAGDVATTMRLAQNLQAGLSEDCAAAFAQAQRAAQTGRGVPAWSSKGGSYRLPAVQDHGGGAYVMAGVGACTPSGCVAC